MTTDFRKECLRKELLKDIFEAIRKRRSVRDYTGDPIQKEDLEKIIDADIFGSCR